MYINYDLESLTIHMLYVIVNLTRKGRWYKRYLYWNF